MAKGDSIYVNIRGIENNLVIAAQQNGRVVEYEFEKQGGINWIVVFEKTRGGTIVRQTRYMADQVLAIGLSKLEKQA